MGKSGGGQMGKRASERDSNLSGSLRWDHTSYISARAPRLCGLQ